jgi:hypothetical protein
MLRELARAHLPEDKDVVNTMHRIKEIIGKKPTGAASFMAATKADAGEGAGRSACRIYGGLRGHAAGLVHRRRHGRIYGRALPRAIPRRRRRASANEAAIAEAYVEEDDDTGDNIQAIFGDSDGDVVVPATTDEQVALLASFETAHCEWVTRHFMVA